MKRFVIKISLVCVIITVVFLTLIVLMSRDAGIPSFRFLGGRNPTAYRKKVDEKTRQGKKSYIYSFPGDFNDICLNAEAELISAGFVNRTLPGNEFRERYYWLKNRFPRGPVGIIIHNNYEYRKHSIPKYSVLSPKDGWIVVEIIYWRGWFQL